MTNGEPTSNQELAGAAPAAKSSSTGGIFEWFWRGAKLKEALKALPPLGEREAAFAQRARSSAEVAQQVLMPDEPMESPAEASACELFRQSAYWSLCALSADSLDAAGRTYDVAVWDTLDESLLTRAAEGAARVEALRASLRAGSFVYFAELPQAEQLSASLELRSLAQALITKLGHRAQVLDAVYLQRAWRIMALGLSFLLLVGGTFGVRQFIQSRSDLAVNASWVASSRFDNNAGCTSPAQQCPQGTGFFFHTSEERSPWIEFDLHAPHEVSKVIIDNRTDCCGDRANALVVEYSNDHEKWRQASHHNGEFASWTATFKPVSTRWIRIRQTKQAYLHLSKVRIF